MNETDVLSIGETMALFAPVTNGPVESRLYAVRPGGAESNVAVHLARLGHRSAWASQLGDDVMGRLIIDEIAAAGVDTSAVQVLPGSPTGVFVKQIENGHTSVAYYRRGSAASTMGPLFLESVKEVGPRIVHLSGVTAALSPSCADLIQRIVVDRALGTSQVSFDVNYRPSLWESRAAAAAALLELSAAADIVFVGRDEAHALWGTHTAEDVRALIPGPDVLVVKDGDIGATEWDGHQVTFVPAHPVAVVEPVGAGDAFAAGWLAAHLRGWDADARLDLGHTIAGYILQTTLDDADFPASLRLDFASYGNG